MKISRLHTAKCASLCGDLCDCDGYHTFDDLYEHRNELFITLCSALGGGAAVWRSKRHSDGLALNDDWFILGIGATPDHQITYHIPMSRWDDTSFAKTVSKAPEWDGHTSDDVLVRLRALRSRSRLTD